MALIEGEWLTPSEAAMGGPRLRATGAVLFATLDMPRPQFVRTIGTWPSATPEAPARGSIAATAARAVSWLLGR